MVCEEEVVYVVVFEDFVGVFVIVCVGVGVVFLIVLVVGKVRVYEVVLLVWCY